MTAGTVPAEVNRTILDRLRDGGETHLAIAADLGIGRATVDRIAREHGYTRRRKLDPLPWIPNRRDDSWIEFAVCGGVRGFTEKPVIEQKKYCGRCPVRADCLPYGLEGPTPTVSWLKTEPSPVHGGVSAPDLRKLKKRKKAS